MTIKLGNLTDWRVLIGASIQFKTPDYDKNRPRRLRLDLNSSDECLWAIVYHRTPILNFEEYQIGREPEFGEPEKNERFFAVIPAGLQTVEFTVAGDFELMPIRPDHCEIHFWTSEAEEYWTEGDGVIFTQPHQRGQRNEAMEAIMFQINQNELRRDRLHAEEIAALRAEIGAKEDGGETGIHGGEAEEHQEPRSVPAAKKAGGKPKAGKPGEAGRGASGKLPDEPAGKSPQGEEAEEDGEE